MVNERCTLLQYLPPFMQGYKELVQIMQAEQAEIDTLWSAFEDRLKDQFINDATDYSISRWEQILRINPKVTDTLDERRFRILTRQNKSLPYTYRFLDQQLSILCGNSGYTVVLDTNAYTLDIKINLENKNNFSDVEELLTRTIPANLIFQLDLLYNTHEKLNFTHDELRAYTHYQLKNEVLPNGN